MLIDIIEAKALPGHRIHLRFEDGVQGEVALVDLVAFEGVFALLKDEREFSKLRVNEELGTIVWPNGADLDPDVLYAVVAGKLIASVAT